MLALSALSLLPDADFIAFHLGIPYSHPLGHRGMTLSRAFALLVGLAVRLVRRLRGRPAFADALLVTAVVASHGVLDAMTTGGLGVEFFWPFDPRRFFLPWRFIPVAPGRLDGERTRTLGPHRGGALFRPPPRLLASTERGHCA
jgi:inner membrane protein